MSLYIKAVILIKILNFGSCNVDYVYALDHIVNAGETETSDSLSIFPGGKGLNQSIALAKAGAEVYHAGCIGADGDILTDILKENHVDISFIRYTTAKNGHAIIQVNKQGENSIFLYPGSNEMISKEHIDETIAHFEAGDILVLQNEINNLEYIIEKAYGIGMCIMLNPSPCNDKIFCLDLQKITYLILNEVEAKDISDCEEPEEALRFFAGRYPALNVMLTLGKNGCIYQEGNTRIYHPIFQVEAVDTTAAGDTFTGYFAAGLAQGMEKKDILKMASCASAISVSRNGAAPSIPDRGEVLEALKMLEVKGSNHSEVLRDKIEKYMSSNLQSASLEELAALLGYSAVYTGSLVKKITGKTFKKYLQDKRLVSSAGMLLETELSIGEIIKNIGYENESFFRGIFKEKYGVNPLEYRRKLRGERE